MDGLAPPSTCVVVNPHASLASIFVVKVCFYMIRVESQAQLSRFLTPSGSTHKSHRLQQANLIM